MSAKQTIAELLVDHFAYTGMGLPDTQDAAEAILTHFVLIPRADLPKVESHHEAGVIAVGGSTFFIAQENFIENTMADIVADIAAIEYVKAGGTA